MLEAEEHERQLPRWNNLRRHQRDFLDGVSKAPALQQTTETEHVIVHVAHDHASHAGTGERDQLVQALRASVGIDPHRPALPAGADGSDGCCKRLAQAVARCNDHQRDTRHSARRNELDLVVTWAQQVAEGRAQARQRRRIGEERQDGGFVQARE